MVETESAMDYENQFGEEQKHGGYSDAIYGEIDGGAEKDESSKPINTATKIKKKLSFSTNVGTIRTTNERFLVMFKEAVKNFRVHHQGIAESKRTWQLGNPTLVNNSYIAYMVEGEHYEVGAFNLQRRYNNFHELHQCLQANWPGIFVPMVPPKKAVGNKDIEFILERRFFLERFYLQVGDLPHLLMSDEVKAFLQLDQ